MRFFRALGRFIWRFMVIFSFIVNIVLVIVVIGLLIFLFDIKNNIAQPLVTGLHSSFVGLDQATIDWTIPVRADVPVNLDIPLKTNTVVTLTEDVPLTVVAQIYASGLTVTNATVYLTLPTGTNLPVALDIPVEVRDQTLPVSLDVRAVIPLEQTQLHDVAENLRLLFEPLAVGLTNLPSDFSGVGPFVGDLFAGRVNLLQSNAYTNQPWQGFSTTAGLNYPEELMTVTVPEENVAVQTGIVPTGGIEDLDEQIRPEVYQAGGPTVVNEQARSQLGNIPSYYYDGGFSAYLLSLRQQQATTGDETSTSETTGDSTSTDTSPEIIDQGILPTPTPQTP
jgi:hypothetical protein